MNQFQQNSIVILIGYTMILGIVPTNVFGVSVYKSEIVAAIFKSSKSNYD